MRTVGEWCALARDRTPVTVGGQPGVLVGYRHGGASARLRVEFPYGGRRTYRVDAVTIEEAE